MLDRQRSTRRGALDGGISFGGVAAFIFADLLILPILNIYRKYYGVRVMLVLLGTFYAAMVIAGYAVEILFGITRLTPTERNAKVEMAHLSWNYTTILNIAFLLLAALLIIRFLRTGGRETLAMMSGPPDHMTREHHHDHDHPGHGAAGAEDGDAHHTPSASAEAPPRRS